jgi:hypothetical protein
MSIEEIEFGRLHLVTDDVVRSPLNAVRSLAHVAALTTLVDKVRPAHTALLVIDMQNDFCADDGFVAKGGATCRSCRAWQSVYPASFTRRAAQECSSCSCAAIIRRRRTDIYQTYGSSRRRGGKATATPCRRSARAANPARNITVFARMARTLS